MEMLEILNSYIAIAAICVGTWFVFKKMGKPGWASLIPFYDLYVLFDAMYGNGWKFLTLLIPFYNIYVGIKMCFDLAHNFGRSTGFGFGLLFLSPIYMMILGFDRSRFKPVNPKPELKVDPAAEPADHSKAVPEQD